MDEAELYCLCLNLYCTTTQYMPQVLTPPTRAHTDALFRVFDIDHSGHLDREEFLLLASIFYENLLMRIARSAISLMLAPFWLPMWLRLLLASHRHLHVRQRRPCNQSTADDAIRLSQGRHRCYKHVTDACRRGIRHIASAAAGCARQPDHGHHLHRRDSSRLFRALHSLAARRALLAAGGAPDSTRPGSASLNEARCGGGTIGRGGEDLALEDGITAAF